MEEGENEQEILKQIDALLDTVNQPLTLKKDLSNFDEEAAVILSLKYMVRRMQSFAASGDECTRKEQEDGILLFVTAWIDRKPDDDASICKKLQNDMRNSVKLTVDANETVLNDVVIVDQ